MAIRSGDAEYPVRTTIGPPAGPGAAIRTLDDFAIAALSALLVAAVVLFRRAR